MKRIACLAALLLLCQIWDASVTRAVAAGQRLALVVGNAAYESTTKLPNAANDARLFSRFLEKQGFDVETLTDVTRADLARGLQRFSDKIEGGDTALFYYAGHGMQLRGQNFLLGVDARLETEFDVAAETLPLDEIIATMEMRAGVSMVFIDACRNNPLAERLARQGETQGAGRGLVIQGLAPVETQGTGTMIAFAASPGQIAYDGGGANSPFTQALVKHLAEKDTEIGTAFKRVIRDVRTLTDNRQSPQIVSNLATEIYLGQAPAGAGKQEEAPPAQGSKETDDQLAQATSRHLTVDARTGDSAAAALFARAERVATRRGWQLFLLRQSTGPLAEEARKRLLRFDFSDRSLPPGVSEARMAMTLADRRRVQGRLIEMGLLDAEVSGDFDAVTCKAILEHQVSLGLPETGFLQPEQAETMGIVLPPTAPGEVDPISDARARKYVKSHLEGLEDDKRILRAVACLKGKDIVYGTFADHVYVVVREEAIDWQGASKAAKKCAGTLAAIGSQAEDEFIQTLFGREEAFFESGYDDKTIWRQGPWIGLRQAKDGAEPAEGWGWENGEELAYENWGDGSPDEWSKNEDYALYFGYEEKPDPVLVDTSHWGDMKDTVTGHSYVMEIQ